LAEIVAATPAADVFLMVDETQRSAGPINFDRVIRYRESDVLALGFSPHAEGALFWYNGDYPLYYFQHLHPHYDLIAMVEYDAVPTKGLDWVVDVCRQQGIDFVGQPIAKTLDTYWWTKSMLHFYPREQVRPYLICAAIFSAHAVRHLAECRIRQGQEYVRPDASGWPIGETFVGTELIAAGFHARDLASFGPLRRYDWWPPAHESELPHFNGDVVVHPVLVGRRYVRSLFKSNFISGLHAVAKFSVPGFARAAWRKVKSAAPMRQRPAPTPKPTD
jgi:hypothetical protein